MSVFSPELGTLCNLTLNAYVVTKPHQICIFTSKSAVYTVFNCAHGNNSPCFVSHPLMPAENKSRYPWCSEVRRLVDSLPVRGCSDATVSRHNPRLILCICKSLEENTTLTLLSASFQTMHTLLFAGGELFLFST